MEVEEVDFDIMRGVNEITKATAQGTVLAPRWCLVGLSKTQHRRVQKLWAKEIEEQKWEEEWTAGSIRSDWWSYQRKRGRKNGSRKRRVEVQIVTGTPGMAEVMRVQRLIWCSSYWWYALEAIVTIWIKAH
jgi:hypothetical protein